MRFIYDNCTSFNICIAKILQALANSLKSAAGKLYPLKCDVSKETDITEAFKWIKAKVGGVDILVNNAGGGFYNTLTGI